MALASAAPSGALPRAPGYFRQDKSNGLLTSLSDYECAEQGGIPMAVQGKGAASRPCERRGARLLTAGAAPAFILVLNIPAGGSRNFRCTGGRGLR